MTHPHQDDTVPAPALSLVNERSQEINAIINEALGPVQIERANDSNTEGK